MKIKIDVLELRDDNSSVNVIIEAASEMKLWPQLTCSQLVASLLTDAHLSGCAMYAKPLLCELSVLCISVTCHICSPVKMIVPKRVMYRKM